ncbi:ribosome biogenesis GTPase Der [Rhodoligotrophos defluvii]|uniref:ribosome biogenesis GTPase Der n=1 Tax=Rhodoligotrophos defluvii TaxID=2561934 RepID=UPI0010C9CC7C|nr:ribosome biogenesis GTPase Der [Rhodoligotrophos defluvii]
MTFTVAIIGRPNVGKSTLFNRLVGKRLALVDDQPGVTRDRRAGDAKLGDLQFTVIDTAGLEEAAEDSLLGRMRQQTEAAIAEADLCLFMIDARAGVTPHDQHFADLLRRAGKPVILIANKAEGAAGDIGLYDAYALGLGEPIAFSAEHGLGTSDLYDAITAVAEEIAARRNQAAPDEAGMAEEAVSDEEAERGPLRLAVTGRPNAGKSTLINRILGEERLLTGPEAGITRDAIAVDWQWRGKPIRFYDTAGLRRRSRVEGKIEKLSVADALRAIQFAEVVVVMVDAALAEAQRADLNQIFEKQDLHIIDLVAREGRAMVVAANKWDLVTDGKATLAAMEQAIERLLPQVRGISLVPVSGRTGQGVDALIEAAFRAYETWQQRISTARLNRWLAEMVERHPPPAPGGRRIKLRYMTQIKARPPTFIVFCSTPEHLPDSYTRYLVNGLRESFGLWGTPIRLHYRKGENPYV